MKERKQESASLARVRIKTDKRRSACRTNKHHTMHTTRTNLLHAAKSLCTDFASKKDPDALMTHFSTTHQCTAYEHGLPILAPFLGRPFVGRDGVRDYFKIIASTLSFETMEFSEYIVDPEVHKVSVKGRAKFTWLSTEQSWDEIFTYALDFDDDFKVTDYQVWADTGAAYLASRGQLRASQEVH
ncbi:hypothetical protein K503DRAFT_201477 [Rhizopogon vinicolor AM-OR11-026]|uniref:SnoaL-like domain-containing protein n=1 Tax=Rhizopogon vinicolor AM-OR11-026 TaxID=1314800 RepID=A0A1B7MZB9_9AGAM|nr:hypothetical protein K503DRAFT_201477 [Rhizopogon vinicolor AM-OR11-026]